MASGSMWQKGIAAGMIGAVTVAVWFFVIDLILARPFFTPAALGSALFQGVREYEMVQVTTGVVLGYTALHLAAFAGLGIAVALAAQWVRKRPPVILGVLLLFVVLQAFFFSLLAVAAEFLLGALAWWGIAGGNLLAAAAMGTWIWQGDPELREAVEHEEPFAEKQ